MDKEKLIKLIISTWKDGNSQFHDNKGSIDYDADLEVWFESIKEDINELCGIKFICAECKEETTEWLNGVCEECTLKSFK